MRLLFHPILRVLALSGYLLLLLVPSSRAQEESEDSPVVARAKTLMTGLGQLTTENERIERRTLLRAMADTLESEDEDVIASHALERCAMISYQLGDYEEMEGDSRRGLAVARRSGDRKRVASLLNVHAIGVSVTGDNLRAAQLQQELIPLRQELGDRRGEGTSWHNLAYSRLALFQTPEAVDALREALRCHQETGNTYGIAVSMASLSNALFDLGRLQEGLAMADSAVHAGEIQGAPAVLGSNLNSRGHKRNWLGYLDPAHEDFERGWTLLDTAGIRNVAAGGAVNWSENLVGLGRCEEALERLDAVEGDLREIGSEATRLYAMAVRGRALLDCGRTEEAELALRAVLEESVAFRDALEAEGSRAESFRIAGTTYTDLAVLHLQQQQMAESWSFVESGSAALLRESLMADEQPTTLSGFQEFLASIDGAALQFSAGSPDRVVAFWITPSRADAHVIQIPEGFRLSLASSLRLLSSDASDEQLAPALQRLATVLFEPLPESLEEFERVVLIPGAFTGFPLETLPLSDGWELGEAVLVSYAPSAAVLLELGEREPSDGPLVAFADPSSASTDTTSMAFPTRAGRLAAIPLPEAREEARAISRGDGELLLGEEATRSALEKLAPEASILHLATHSLIDATHPEGSALLLAGGDAGMITADAIAGISLGCDLASLSGCSTAGGYVVAGEGTLGLTRSFLQAGARSVVATRWDVEDRAARLFMEAFYRALREGQERDRAMQSARRTLRDEGAGHRDRSAFMLVGVAAEPVSMLAGAGGSSSSRAPLLIALALGVIVLGVALRRR